MRKPAQPKFTSKPNNRQPIKSELVKPEAEPNAAARIYGVAPVLEALRAGRRTVEQIFVAENAQPARLRELFEMAREQKIVINRVPRQNLAKLVDPTINHQGVVALVAAAAYANADELLASIAAKIGTDDPPLALVLDGVEDPRNLGAIIRTAECVGANGIFLPERRAVGLTEIVSKASAGALENVLVAKVTNITNLLGELKEAGIWTVGTSLDAKQSYTDWDWRAPSAIVLGGEGKGLHRLVAENCDALVKIPMFGAIQSLNVSVAAGVVLYEARRQRQQAVSGEQ